MRLVSKTRLEEKFQRWDLETEKHHCFTAAGVIVHNCNTRLALIEGMFMAGSHNLNLKEFNEKGIQSKFWGCFTPNIKALLSELASSEGITVVDTPKPVILFGEIYGMGLQDLHYGEDKPKFRAFDISVDGKYLDYDAKVEICKKYDVPMVPILYRGPFNKATMEQHTDGPTTLCDPAKAGKFKGREGIVITPVKERYDFDLGGSGRVILKSISADYHARKGGTDFH
jgi:RNA ligase (TIGR02306 family)